jgi:hypothetical protein
MYTGMLVDLPSFTARTEQHRNTHVTDTGTWLKEAVPIRP